MLRFSNLGSGSAGNATVVEARSPGSVRRLLIDCGFGPRQLAQRLGRVGLACDDLDAIFITHEHSDHVGCAVSLAQRHGIALYMSGGTHAAIGSPDMGTHLRLVRDGDCIDLGALEVRPFTVPHDAREPLQLRCSTGQHHLGVATDLGHATVHVLAHLAGCHALMLEANHDTSLLAQSAYPEFLKRRIGGPYGHLSNSTSVEMLTALRHAGLAQVVAAHLSERNNAPGLVRTLFAQTLAWPEDAVVIADPQSGTPWIEVG